MADVALFDQVVTRFDDDDRLDRWVDLVRRAGGRVVQVSPHRRTLEEYFVDMVRTGGESAAAGGER